MPRKTAVASQTGSESIVRRIRDLLNGKPLSRPGLIEQWCRWAAVKLDRGWTDDQVVNHIRNRWLEHSHTLPDDSIIPELESALEDVYRQVDQHGWKPPQVAVVYRSLASQYPQKPWLSDWADRFLAMGDSWKPLP